MSADSARESAKKLPFHYLKLCSPQLAEDHDCQVEIEEIVDSIIEAAVEIIHEENVLLDPMESEGFL